MNTFWGLTGYLPLFLYALLLYWLLAVLPKWFKKKLKGRVEGGRSGAAAGPAPEAVSQERLRAVLSRSPRENSAAAPASSAPPRAPFNRSNTLTMNEPRLPATVSEPVSVVLRRQVPPRTMEPARSWLGGLPHLPDEVEWPRSISSEHPQQGERPLHFLAQICCADLPRELWAGLGPREGWLLIFIDPNQGDPESSDAFRIMHIPQLGPERETPFDLGPVHDGLYTGGSYRWLPTDEVPAVWRRWPVDIVSVPNVLHRSEGRSFATPEGFAKTLYGGAPVLAYGDLKTVRPYLVGQALKAVHCLAAAMRAEPRPVMDQYTYGLLYAEGSLDRLRDSSTIQLAKTTERPESAHRALMIDGLTRTLALVASCDKPETLQRRLEVDREQWRRWRLSIATDCDEMATMLSVRASDAPLSQDDWEQLQACFVGKEYRGLELSIDRVGGAKQLDLSERREQANLTIPKGTTDDALMDWLNPETRSRVPADRLSDLEAAARSLRSNRPHRMGGYHDGVQSDAIERPTNQLLLLQIASDDGMDWCWGDVGAYYFWIRPQHLDAGDFSGVEMSLECH